MDQPADGPMGAVAPSAAMDDAITAGAAAGFASKHPLEHRWVMHFEPASGGKRGSGPRKSRQLVMSFDSIEDFWCLYNNIVQASQLTGAAYFLCLDGQPASWSHASYRGCGRWVLDWARPDKSALDGIWMFTLLGVVGGSLDPRGDVVCGATVEALSKSVDRISLWTREAVDEMLQREVGARWQAVLNLPLGVNVYFLADGGAPEPTGMPTAVAGASVVAAAAAKQHQ